MTLKELGFASYADYLKSPHWKSFKAIYRKSGRSQTCAVCGVDKVDLHHMTYARLGNESVGDVVPLCREDHEKVHAMLDDRGWRVERSLRIIRMLRPDYSAPPMPKKARHGPTKAQRKKEKRAAWRRDAADRKAERLASKQKWDARRSAQAKEAMSAIAAHRGNTVGDPVRSIAFSATRVPPGLRLMKIGVKRGFCVKCRVREVPDDSKNGICKKCKGGKFSSTHFNEA